MEKIRTDGEKRALRFGYHLAADEERRHKAIRDSVIADTNSRGVVGLKRTREMISDAFIRESNRIYRETGAHKGNYANDEYYDLIRTWEKRANRDFKYLNEWERDYYKVQKDAEAGRIYLVTREDLKFLSDYGLTLTKIFSQENRSELKKNYALL